MVYVLKTVRQMARPMTTCSFSATILGVWTSASSVMPTRLTTVGTTVMSAQLHLDTVQVGVQNHNIKSFFKLRTKILK